MENTEDDENDIKKYNELKLLPTTLAEILPSTDFNIRLCSDYLLKGNIIKRKYCWNAYRNSLWLSCKCF